MPGLRLLFRMAPLLVGVLAAAVWLRRREARQQLPPPPPVAQIDIVTVVDDLLDLAR